METNNKTEHNWIKVSDELPECNVSVLVYIPEEDNHVTTGMWDVSQKWVLLDDYRIPTADVTYWHPMIDKPKDGSYNQRGIPEDQETTTGIIRTLQKKVFELEKERDEFLCISEPMPLPDAIKHLLTATNILLHRKDYDGPDYEEMEYAIMIGKKFLEQFKSKRK